MNLQVFSMFLTEKSYRIILYSLLNWKNILLHFISRIDENKLDNTKYF